MARVRLVVLGIVLLGAAIGAWLPGSAAAALHNPIPADASGDPNDTFTDNQSLWAYFQSDIGGGRICVVPENGPLEVLSCDHPAKGMGTARVRWPSSSVAGAHDARSGTTP